jgi:hypothetical protein
MKPWIKEANHKRRKAICPSLCPAVTSVCFYFFLFAPTRYETNEKEESRKLTKKPMKNKVVDIR